MFRQEISHGEQVELPETWLEHPWPWEFERRELACRIGFGGVVVPAGADTAFTAPAVWSPDEHVEAVAYDTPVVGWRGSQVNTLRLWSAVPIDPIELDRFNAGDHVGALEENNRAEALSRVLYPADSHKAGQELRFRQEYFWASASLQDIIRRHLARHPDLSNLAVHAAIQLNDTHPAIAVPELLRLLVDVHGFEFAEAWDITRATLCYTNHTLLPEALESWPIGLFEQLLPRHLQLVYAVNSLVLTDARTSGNLDGAAIGRVSLIGEEGERRVRMGSLAFVGSHSVNGVAALHSELMKETVFSDLNRLHPDRINNKTNGVTQRRWLFQCNPGLTALMRDTIGDGFLDDFGQLARLDEFATDAEFQARFADVKLANKQGLAELVQRRNGVSIDPHALFDVHVKRIHEYKRQLLNLLHAVDLYHRIREQPDADWTPWVKLFGGKAAPSYDNAKLIIHLANDIAATINADPAVSDLLKVVFVPNYNVSTAEVMMPAADLSEQISTAGMEASGTGNMKLALNGAITIGTLDGANVEMRDHMGEENMVIFGLTADEVVERRSSDYDPRAVIEGSPRLRRALESVASGEFNPGEPGRYRTLIDALYSGDWFMVAADFDAYIEAQEQVDQLWRDPARWNEMAIHSVARMSWFSSDRTIAQYATEIWGVEI
jgi:starch phosphorylase